MSEQGYKSFGSSIRDPLAVHVLSGEWDVILRVRAKNIDEMNQFLVDFLRPMPAVERTLTMFNMSTNLETLDIRRA
ncbi:MAG: Lrp/AsnC ligand binding domain-containing protein [Candidatus Thorarchaeota archaeon]